MQAYMIKLIASLITEDIDDTNEYSAAVAIIRNKDKWLLGLAKNNYDDRDGKWVFPGGGIKDGETPEEAAVREAKEETGLLCKAVSGIFTDVDKKDVAFVYCKASGKDIKMNHEFSHMDFFTVDQMSSLNLYRNVKRLIRKVLENE